MSRDYGSLICVLIGCLVFASSCRYQPGASEGRSSSIFVQVVKNDSSMPQSSGVVSRAIREEFLRRGTFELVHSAEEADLVLRINLREYGKSPEVFRSEDTLLAVGFNLEAGATVNLYSSRRKTFLIENHVIRANASTLRQGVTEQPKDRQPSAALARQLGVKIANLVANHSW
jgi:hypothetical protein